MNIYWAVAAIRRSDFSINLPFFTNLTRNSWATCTKCRNVDSCDKNTFFFSYWYRLHWCCFDYCVQKSMSIVYISKYTPNTSHCVLCLFRNDRLFTNAMFSCSVPLDCFWLCSVFSLSSAYFFFSICFTCFVFHRFVLFFFRIYLTLTTICFNISMPKTVSWMRENIFHFSLEKKKDSAFLFLFDYSVSIHIHRQFLPFFPSNSHSRIRVHGYNIRKGTKYFRLNTLFGPHFCGAIHKLYRYCFDFTLSMDATTQFWHWTWRLRI